MLRLSFEMLKSSSKRPKSAQKEKTMLKTHDRISKCSDSFEMPKLSSKTSEIHTERAKNVQNARQNPTMFSKALNSIV